MIGGSGGGGGAQPEFARRTLNGGLRRDHLLLGEDLQHQVAPLAHALRVAPGIVERGAAHDGHQRRGLDLVELGQRLAEIEGAGEAKAVNGPLAVLAHEHLVDVGRQDVVLVVAPLQQDGHRGLGDLATPGAPAVEEVALHQLLGQRAAALAHFAGAQVDHQRATDALRVDAPVPRETPVLDRDQRIREQCGNLVGREHDAVLAVRREDAADAHRVEPEQRQIATLRVADAIHAGAAEIDLCDGGRLQAVGEVKRPGHEPHAGALAPPEARSGRAAVGRPIALCAEQFDELAHGQRQAGIEFDRLGEHLRGLVPAPALELRRDARIQPDHPRRERDCAQQRGPERERCEAPQDAS